MKTTLIFLISSLILAATATESDQQCDLLRHQCDEFRTKCSPDMMNMKSCCDIVDLPLAKAPTGVYQIVTNCSCGSPFTAAVDAYCDMETDDGGWMVIQRNIKDSKLDSIRKNWKDYEEGFGDLSTGLLWYGLKALSCFTEKTEWELRIDVQFTNRTSFYLHYNTFKVGSPSSKYKLTIGGFTETITDDPFVSQPLDGKPFSTPDNDNDEHFATNCAATYSGWWHNKCYRINPNSQPPRVYFKSKNYNLLSIEMKIRPRDCIIQ